MTAVPSVLAPYVAAMTVYDLDLGAPGLHRGLPSTTLTLVLPIGEPVDVGWSGDPVSRGRRWSIVSGLHTVPAEIHHRGHQAGVQLALTTAGARALLGVPAGALRGQLLEVADLDHDAPWLRDLPDRLAGAGGAGRRRPTVTAALARQVGRHRSPAPRPEVARAIAALDAGAR